MIVRDLDDYLRHIQNNMHPAFIKNIAKEMQEKDKEIKRLKEEYMMLQNASDKVEEEKDRQIERLNNIINEAIKWFEDADRRSLQGLLDILKGVDKK